MKRITATILAALMLLPALQAPARTTKPTASFREDGTFRILQLSDLHMQIQHPEETAKVFARMDSLVKWEQPDFITVTGDLLYSVPAKEMLTAIVAKLDSFGRPWTIIYGNHDAEQDLSRAEMSKIIAAGRYSVNTLNADGELADIEVPVRDGDGEPWYMYFMDSHDYSTVPGIKGYGWFSTDQVEWLRGCVKARTAADGTVAPSIAFFHIPLCEYVDACTPACDPHRGTKDFSQCFGNIGENVACGAVNTGMFAAMKETGSVVGTFCGHDHDNDFVAVYQGIALAYGRFSGTDCEYNDLPKGARIIVIRKGDRGFETWLREDSGRYSRRLRFNGTKLVLPKWKDDLQLYGTLTDFE